MKKTEGILLGLDVGNVWIGVAKTDVLQQFVWPMCTVRNGRFREWLGGLKFEVSGIVVGWPFLEDGTEGEQCRAVERFIDSLQKFWSGPVFRQDERLTSYYAKHFYGVDEDSMAAALILEAFLGSGSRDEER